MGDPRGFLLHPRKKPGARPPHERRGDFREFDHALEGDELRTQASRCMDCGIPFCHNACPLGNLIPEWNDAVHRGASDEAREALEATNNFPEVTGRVCPAPCEAACVLGIDEAPVTIKDVERAIADEAQGPLPVFSSARPTGRSAAVIGSGPAGLAAAQELARRGHAVTVFERDDRIGGLLRYGIPDYKLEKHLLDRRIAQLEAEGVRFVTSAHVGDSPSGDELRRSFDATIVCIGARRGRPLGVPGDTLAGVYPAMVYLEQQNRRVAGETIADEHSIVATGKRVVILGGGDTGADCLGTAHRQGAVEIAQLELMPAPPLRRMPNNPWPEWPLVMRTSSSHEEGGERSFALRTIALVGNDEGRVAKLLATRVERIGSSLRDVPGDLVEIECDLVLLATGFVGVEPSPLFAQLAISLDARGNVAAPDGLTSTTGVFAAGDAIRGASLVVTAIADGRRAAAAAHTYLRSLGERAITAAQ